MPPRKVIDIAASSAYISSPLKFCAFLSRRDTLSLRGMPGFITDISAIVTRCPPAIASLFTLFAEEYYCT